MIWQNIRLALKTLGGNKLRSFLTMLGIVIGVASVTAVVALGQGFKNQIRGEINNLGANLINVTPGEFITKDKSGQINLGEIDFSSAFGASTLSERDLKTIKEDPDITSATPIMVLSGTVAKNDQNLRGVTIIATDSDYPAVLNQKVIRGQFFNGDDQTNKAVVGAELAREISGSIDALTSTVEVRGQLFVVVGVLEKADLSGLGSFGPDLNRAILLPLVVGKNFNQGATLIQEIDAVVADGANVDETIARLEEKLIANHGGEQDFTILKQEDFIALTDTFSTIATQFVAAIASISLIVGGIGIMNIMLVSVAERTREIGLRKAIGASNAHVLMQFLIEAIILSVIGGLIGVGIAYAGVGLVSAFSDFSGSFSIEVILLATGVSAMVGILAGLWPAWQAARKNPIDALRHE